jgi:ferritin
LPYEDSLLSQELDSTASFFRLHAEEEKQHMMKLFDYINETGDLGREGAKFLSIIQF